MSARGQARVDRRRFFWGAAATWPGSVPLPELPCCAVSELPNQAYRVLASTGWRCHSTGAGGAVQY